MCNFLTVRAEYTAMIEETIYISFTANLQTKDELNPEIEYSDMISRLISDI